MKLPDRVTPFFASILKWRANAMTDTDLFALTCLPCPICKVRYYRGATIRIVAVLCSACKHCEYHCRCVAGPSLEALPPFDLADEPIEVIGGKNP